MKTILILEDDVVFCKMLSRFLATKNYKTLEALNAAEARGIINSSEGIDFALIDQKLPDDEGINVLKNLMEKFPKVKGIMMSRFHSEEQTQEFKKAGAIEFIKKPIKPTELVEIVEKHNG